jgi:hypothetical protein
MMMIIMIMVTLYKEYKFWMSLDSSAGIVAGWMPKGWEFQVPVGIIFLPFMLSRLVPGVHPASYTMCIGALPPGVKRPGHEADPSPPTSAEVRNTWTCRSTSPYIFMA